MACLQAEPPFYLMDEIWGPINRRLGLGSLVSCCRQCVAMCGSVWQGPVSHHHGDRHHRGTHTLAQTLHSPHTPVLETCLHRQIPDILPFYPWLLGYGDN